MSPPTPKQLTQFAIVTLIILLLGPAGLTLGTPAVQEPTASPSRAQHTDLSSVTLQNSSSGQQPTTQTLTITSTHGSSEYVLRVTGSVAYGNNSGDPGDIIQGKRMSGDVGSPRNGTSDTKDVIYFTGFIAQFHAGENVTVVLNGHRVPQDVLSGHYIQLIPGNGSNAPTQYAFTVTGAIAPATTADRSNGETISPNDSTVSGTLGSTDQDSFYYSGTIRRLTIDDPARVFIDGKHVSATTPQAPTPTITTSPTPPETQIPTGSDRSPTETATTTPLLIGDSPFTITNLSVSSTSVTVNEPVTITVRVSNENAQRIKAPVRLATDGTIVSKQSVALFPGSWQQVQFQHTFSVPGQYIIRIGETHQTIRVREHSQTPTDGGGIFGSQLIVMILIGSLVVGLGSVLLRRWVS